MTPLRDQLRQARSAYESVGYPGDLAADLLPPPPRALGGPRRWAFPLALGGAVAATVALVATSPLTAPAGRPGTHHPLVASPVTPSAVAPTPAVYPWPARMPLTLPAAPLVPTTPPVLVSLDGLSDLPQSYDALNARLLQNWNRSRLGFPPAPTPADRDAAPAPATQQAA